MKTMGRMMNRPAPLSGERRTAICAFLEANGISPNDVPMDAQIHIDWRRRKLNVEVVKRCAAGRPMLGVGDQIQRGGISVDMVSDPPENLL